LIFQERQGEAATAPHPVGVGITCTKPASGLEFTTGRSGRTGAHMNFRPWIGAAVVATHVGVQAATGSVDFRIDDYPSLASSAAAADASGAAGYWITDNHYDSRLDLTRDWLGPFPHPGTGSYYTSAGADAAGLSGAPFGEVQRELTWASDPGLSARSYFRPGQIGTAWQTAAADDVTYALVNWDRSFALKPNSSVTLAGSLNFSYSAGGLEPIYEYNHFRGIEPTQAAITFAGREIDDTPWDNRIGFGFGLRGTIFDADPRGADPGTPRPFSEGDFGYSVDSFGHLSLTIFNRSSEWLFGAFEITSGASSPPPIPAIPEPATWAAMLLGLGIVGLSRRQASRIAGRVAA
jgi:hypothetical protein